jgi:hypothetical protein
MRQTLLWVLAGIAATGCKGDVGDVNVVPERSKAAVIYGVVTNAQGNGVANVNVEVRMVLIRPEGPAIENCRGLPIPLAERTVTQPNGSFRVKVATEDPENRVCIIAAAMVPATGTTKVVSGTEILLKADVPGAVLDSARVDIRLPS